MYGEASAERFIDLHPTRIGALFAVLPQTLLTFAAEHAGGKLDSDVVVPVLLELLGQPSAIVREGAVLGLYRHLGVPSVRAAIERLREDESPGVIMAASDVLAEYLTTKGAV